MLNVFSAILQNTYVYMLSVSVNVKQTHTVPMKVISVWVVLSYNICLPFRAIGGWGKGDSAGW